jgi:hypothetical protein
MMKRNERWSTAERNRGQNAQVFVNPLEIYSKQCPATAQCRVSKVNHEYFWTEPQAEPTPEMHEPVVNENFVPVLEIRADWQ